MGDSSGTGFSTANLQKGDTRYNVLNGVTYQYIGGSAQESSNWRAVYGKTAYAQLSNILGSVPPTLDPYWVTFHQIDSIRNMSISQNGGTSIIIEEKGTYQIVNGVQVSKTGGGGAATYLDHWIAKNEVTIPNTGVRIVIPTAAVTNVLTLNWIGELEVGDTIQKFLAVSDIGIGIGIYSISPPVGPLIPAGLFTIVKLAT